MMDQNQALRILNALANGVHPAAGEVFPADCPYQSPDTLRALFVAIRCMEGSKPTPPQVQKQNEDKATVPANTFVRWTEREERRLVAAFDAGKSTAELAKLHNRSRAAVEARLLKLGKIDVSALTVQLRYSGKSAGT
jgi:hypothetical protein